MVNEFIYKKEADTYTCPQGETLTNTVTWHKKTRERDSHQVKKYRIPKCKECSVKILCTARVSGGQEIDRSEFAEAVTANNIRYQENASQYRKRHEINEHIWHHQAALGLQPHQPQWTGKSWRQTCFDPAGIQHQKVDEYSRCIRFDRKTKEFQAS
jgi:hypothetical protein